MLSNKRSDNILRNGTLLHTYLYALNGIRVEKERDIYYIRIYHEIIFSIVGPHHPSDYEILSRQLSTQAMSLDYIISAHTKHNKRQNIQKNK